MMNKHKQKGAETVEFAMIALLLFAVLFAIIEFSRALFVWNALAEATRRGARMAVVCPVGSGIPKQVAMFGDKGGSLTTSPIIAGLTPAMVNVEYFYYDAAGIKVTVTAEQPEIAFAQVKIIDYTHTLLIPLWFRTITAPEFETTLPTESRGAVPTYPGETKSNPACNF
jgi:Flp pilus assembly protein TadG